MIFADGMVRMWVGLAMIVGAAAILLAIILVKIRGDMAADAEEFADPISDEQAAAERLAALQRQIERDRKPAHRNLEEETHALVRHAVATSRARNGRRDSRWEPRWWTSRPRAFREG